MAEISSDSNEQGENCMQQKEECKNLQTSSELSATIDGQSKNEIQCSKHNAEEHCQCAVVNNKSETVEEIASNAIMKDNGTQTDEFIIDLEFNITTETEVQANNPLSSTQGKVSELYLKAQKNVTNESTGVQRLNKNELLIPRISTNLQTNALAIVTAALVANDKELKDVSPQMIMSLYCGMYNIYLAFLNVPTIVSYLVKFNYRVKEVSIEEWTTRISLLRKGVNHIVAHFVGENANILSKLSWTLFGPLLCLLGHKPKKYNINYWGNKMLKTFYVETKLPIEMNNLLFYPSLRFCEILAFMLDNMWEIRRYLFYVVYNTASTVPKLPGSVCRLAIEHQRGEGLIDFILIDQYLLVQNPFSLLLNKVANHIGVLLEAYEKYMEFGHLAPWCTIIAPPEVLRIFKHPGIKFVAAVARGLALKKGVIALENYYPMKENNEIRETVAKAIMMLKEIKVERPNEQNKEDKSRQ